MNAERLPPRTAWPPLPLATTAPHVQISVDLLPAPPESRCTAITRGVCKVLGAPYRLTHTHWPSLCASMMHGVRDGVLVKIPAKLAALGVFLATNRLIESSSAAAPALGLFAVGASAVSGGAFGARISHSLLDTEQSDGDPRRDSLITLSAIAGGALGAAAVGCTPVAILALGSVIGAACTFGLQARLCPSQRATNTLLALGAVAGCSLILAATWTRTGYREDAALSDDPPTLYAKQVTALLEALLAELIKDSFRGFGPSVNRQNVSVYQQSVVSILALPFYATATVFVSGYAGKSLKPASGVRRYDEYLPATLISCGSDFVKGLFGTLILTIHAKARVEESGPMLSRPRIQVLGRVPTRAFMMVVKNSLYDLTLHLSHNPALAVAVSQGSYALSIMRDPLHEAIDRRFARNAAGRHEAALGQHPVEATLVRV